MNRPSNNCILLVEDNPGDILLTKEALKNSKIRTRLHVVSNGEMALQYLSGINDNGGNTEPRLILLDLNLPKIDGREVLRFIKNKESLKHIPVIILSMSKSQEDILNCYKLHANCFISKPIDFEQFTDVMRSIETYWFSTVKLPYSG